MVSPLCLVLEDRWICSAASAVGTSLKLQPCRQRIATRHECSTKLNLSVSFGNEQSSTADFTFKVRLIIYLYNYNSICG